MIFDRPAAAVCRDRYRAAAPVVPSVSARNRSARGTGGHCSEDVPDHHALQHIVFIDVEVPDIGHMLEIDILQHATEVLTPVDRIAETIGDVVIDVTIDVSSRGHAGGRIEPDRQFDRHTVLAQACNHAGHRYRTRRVPDQDYGPHAGTFVLGRGLFRQGRSGQIIIHSGVDATPLQLGRNLVHAQREHIERTSEQINMLTGLAKARASVRWRC